MHREQTRAVDWPWKRLALLLLVFVLIGLAIPAGAVAESDDPLARSLRIYGEAFARKDYPRALQAAATVIRVLKTTPGDQTKNIAMAFNNLARAEQALGRWIPARRHYEESIGLIESRSGVYSSDLLTPLANLGALYYQVQDYEKALDTFRRAQHITHRQGGVDALDQLEWIDWMTLVHLDTGDVRAADTQQRLYYRVNVHQFGIDDPDLLPANNKMAGWFISTGQPELAIEVWWHALDIADRNHLARAEKIQPLRGISTAMLMKGVCCHYSPLQEVLEIVSGDPAFDRTDRLGAEVHLADALMIRHKHRLAARHYRQAWLHSRDTGTVDPALFDQPVLLGHGRVEDIAEAFDRTLQKRRSAGQTVYTFHEGVSAGPGFSLGNEPQPATSALIGSPLPLCESATLELARTRETERLQDYFVDLNFTVTDKGSVRNVSLVDSNAPVRLQRYVTNTLRKAKYRPSIRDGATVDTDNIRLRQTFTTSRLTHGQRSAFNRVAADGRRVAALGCQMLAMR